MRTGGSVLVVVLGLLAILAVVGVALITMTGVDRQSAQSFAIQTQLSMAADGAVAYVNHHLISDCWTYSTSAKKYTTLLDGIGTVETYDYASLSGSSGTLPDPWLSGPIEGNLTPNPVSFGAVGATTPVTAYGLSFGASGPDSDKPDNLSMPVPPPAAYNGVWLPDPSMPFEQYVVRVSVTVVDHGALLNLNAHGNQVPSGGPWDEDDAIGYGFFISDVNPQLGGGTATIQNLVAGTSPPGRWGTDGVPGIPSRGETLIERPGLGTNEPAGAGFSVDDRPFTLAEEFELRRLSGTLFKSRLESIWGGFETDWTNRLRYTTVGWTAEVIGDYGAAVGTHLTDPDDTDNARSARKLDLNLDKAKDIYKALSDRKVFTDDAVLRQLVANLDAARDLDNTIEQVDLGGAGTGPAGAERQPFFSEVTANVTVKTQPNSQTGGNDTIQTWTIKLELFNPWIADSYGEAAAPGNLTCNQLTVSFDADTAAGDQKTNALTSMKSRSCLFGSGASAVFTVHVDVNVTQGQTLTSRFRNAQLTANVGGKLVLDQIAGDELSLLSGAVGAGAGSSRIFRRFGIEGEKRGSDDLDPMTVVYVYDWAQGGSPDPGNPGEITSSGNSGIPIRIMNCVEKTYCDNVSTKGPLPLRYKSGTLSYKAFARLGELDRVMCPNDGEGAAWWDKPWVVRATRDHLSSEDRFKFDWVRFPMAANCLCVGGPWADGIDNDGDGKTDLDDKGFVDDGGHGGPEFRVAGKINLNTATDLTMSGLLSGVGMPASAGAAIKGLRPIDSVAKIVSVTSTVGGTAEDAKGALEKRDLVFTRLSNIATTRSDTFSIYGTVQLVDVRLVTANNLLPRIIQSRRFWAIVDRSPCLAYPPGTYRGTTPRVLNFQWLD